MSKPPRALCPSVNRLESRLLLSRAKPAIDTNLVFNGAVASRLGDSAAFEITRPTGRGQVQVEVTTPSQYLDPTTNAQPGVDFQPIDQVLTFAPGQTSQTVQVPLIHPSPHASPINLEISGHILGSAPSSYQDFGGSYTLVDHTDVTGPKVVASHLIQKKGLATGLSLTFDEPLAPASVLPAGPYYAFVAVPSQPHTRIIRLISDPSLDPTNMTLTLTFRAPRRLAANQVVVIESYLSGLTNYNVAASDPAGNAVQEISLQFSTAHAQGKPIIRP